MPDYVTRAKALTTTCPICQAAPGQPCFGARGKPRIACHRDRQQPSPREPRLYDLDQTYVPPEHSDTQPARQPTAIPDDDRTRGLVHCRQILEELAARGHKTGRPT
jgi:hypothetical protein